MHRELVQPVHFTPDKAAGAVTLLDQFDKFITPDTMQRHGMQAFRILKTFMDEDPVVIDERVKQLSDLRLVQMVNQTDANAMALAVAASAVLMAGDQGAQNPFERIEGAMLILSERYQADW